MARAFGLVGIATGLHNGDAKLKEYCQSVQALHHAHRYDLRSLIRTTDYGGQVPPPGGKVGVGFRLPSQLFHVLPAIHFIFHDKGKPTRKRGTQSHGSVVLTDRQTAERLK